MCTLVDPAITIKGVIQFIPLVSTLEKKEETKYKRFNSSNRTKIMPDSVDALSGGI
jgi:hypothetical protein